LPPPPRSAGDAGTVTAGLSPDRFSSSRQTFLAQPPPAAAAAASAAEPAVITEWSTGATRYKVICKRLYALPDPTYFKALNGEHEGEYSTGKAEVRLDPDGLFAIVSTLELCRGLHTLRLVHLQRGGKPLFTQETLASAVMAVRAAAPLKLLDLSNDALDDEVAAGPLGKLLANNTNLTGLILRSNFLSHLSAKAILANLSTNRTLLELDTSDNLQLRWPGQAHEYEKLLKENTSITSFGASLKAEAATAVINAFLRSPSRMRRVQLTMLELTPEQIGSVAAWIASKTVRAAAWLLPFLGHGPPTAPQ
jgi:hypothetical protein